VYDEHEWLVIDLRVAEALRRACRADEAAELEAWVTAVARANHDTVPELLEPNTGDFAGPAPMLGFGAGAWVLAVAGRDAADAACLAAVDTGTTKDPATGCGCASASPAFAAWSTLAALALAARRRKP
jgi:MYXO-CTERM domain-containing protein